MERAPRSVGIVLFDDFELLDVFGPAELLSRLPGQYALTYTEFVTDSITDLPTARAAARVVLVGASPRTRDRYARAGIAPAVQPPPRGNAPR